MALTQQEEITKKVAQDAFVCGEDIGRALNNLMDTLQGNADGFKGVAGSTFQRIQAELYQQVDKMNQALDQMAETMIGTADNLSMSDLDTSGTLEQAWSDGGDAYADALGSGQLK